MRLQGKGTQQKAVTAGGQRSLADVHNCLGLGRQSLKFEFPKLGGSVNTSNFPPRPQKSYTCEYASLPRARGHTLGLRTKP